MNNILYKKAWKILGKEFPITEENFLLSYDRLQEIYNTLVRNEKLKKIIKKL